MQHAGRNWLDYPPLESKVLVAAINFWQHITSQNTFVNKIYSVTETTNTWSKKLKILLVSYAFLS